MTIPMSIKSILSITSIVSIMSIPSPALAHEPHTKDAILDAICEVESSDGRLGRELFPHYSCRHSWGYYGLTQSAIDTLIDRKLLPAGAHVSDLCGKHSPRYIQRQVAAAYLDVCLDWARAENVYGPTAGWFQAALVYHGHTGARLAPARRQYATRLQHAIERLTPRTP
jgi:hypothetical protein